MTATPVPDGDRREDEIEVSVMVADTRGRLNVLEYDHDMDDETDDEEATGTIGSSGMISFAHIPADMEITIVADAGSGMLIVPDTRASSEFDAFGDQLDDYPDGKMVGAYGDGSGARPDVWICPLWRLDHEDPNDNCSTFAYKWADGTISGDISGLRKGDKATVTLTPVNSNDDYSDDLEDEEEVTAGNGGAAEYSFASVADGRYTVTLEANPGSWEEDDVKGISVMHDEEEGDDDDEYSGDVQSGKDLSATDLRGTIRGRIANDSNGRAGLTGDESRSGVVVAIHAAKEITSGDEKGDYTDGGAVTDENDDPVMAETDEDGVFMFEGLVVGNMYLVKPQETDLYTAVRNGNPDIGAEKTTDVVPHALATAGLPPRAGTEPAIPTWNYHTSTDNLADGTADFVLLYKNGEIEGEVSDPSVRSAHKYSTVELHHCKLTDQSTPATGCGNDGFSGEVVEASVDDDGDWEASGLIEGYWEVVVDLPAGYENVNESGAAENDDDTNTADVDENTYHTRQLAELIGGRADASTDAFHIKDRNAGDGAVLTSVAIVDGTAGGCQLGDGTNRCIDNDHDDATISVTVTASTGATVRLSTDATDAKATDRSMAVNNGKASTVTLPKAGSTTFFAHVAAADGYSTNADNVGTAAGFSVRRDGDVRVKMVTITWNGGRIDLDRDEFGLDPDGETLPVTGTTTLSVTMDEGDGGDDEIPTALTVRATGMNSTFGTDAWSGEVAVGTACSDTAADYTAGDVSVTLPETEAGPPVVKGSVIHCFRINDSDGANTSPDQNEANYATYRLILTRK